MLALLLASSALLPQLRLSPPLCPTPHCVRAAGVSMAAEELVEQFTDWVEDFSPQLLKSEPEPAIVPLRVLAGILMVHHGSEGGLLPANFGSDGFEGFVDFIVKPYFGFLPGSPAFWAALHDYVEFFGGLFVALGLLTRPASVALAVTMAGAVYFHLASTGLQGFPLGHVENYSYNFEEPALYLAAFVFLATYGGGPFSLDSKLLEKINVAAEEE
mmetsp:Transcript_10998/g.18739  ORF Transcript_10998/g.18739 Transcript_10998/m.18739 type:complete len:215 (+) Transcript_10998:36-680(+)